MNNKQTILIIDDEPDIRELLVITLSRMGYETQCAEDYQTAIQLLKQNNYDLCLSDMRLPDGNGIDIVEHIQQLQNPCPVAVITAHGNMELAIKALKAGAFDFVSKPISLDLLRNLITQALTAKTNLKVPSSSTKTDEDFQIVGESEAILQLKKSITKLSRSQAPVYIQADSGTGKELVARQIHKQSSRLDAPFIAVNCGAIPSELMESELFGHTKGSFTGATQDKQGLFIAAQGGTLFLDEIADLPLNMQVKLLRVIQDKKVRAIGSQEEITLDVRIISASHKDLNQLVADGDFRQDLFYRINVIHIAVPPLAQRIADLPLLVPHILNKINAQNNTNIKISEYAIKQLSSYSFPGNIRELENILERASALCEEQLITDEDLNLPTINKENQINLTTQTSNIEKEQIEHALAANQWNQSATARQLGITLRQLRYRMDKFGLK